MLTVVSIYLMFVFNHSEFVCHHLLLFCWGGGLFFVFCFFLKYPVTAIRVQNKKQTNKQNIAVNCQYFSIVLFQDIDHDLIVYSVSYL